MSTERRPLAALLAEHPSALTAAIRREAGRALLRLESVEDLSQGAVEALLAADTQHAWTGEAGFVAWLGTVARNHVRARARHWARLKRGSGALLERCQAGELGPELDSLAASVTGPATQADRREQWIIATRALDLLTPKDRARIDAFAADVPLALSAERDGVPYATAQRARLRALERFRKAFELVKTDGAANRGDPGTKAG